MAEIKCPKCGEVFKVDESGYAEIVNQVRGKEFEKELDKRVNEKVTAAEEVARAEKDKEIARLSSELEKIKETSENEVKLAESKKDTQIAELQAQIKSLEEKTQTEVKFAESEKDKVIDGLKAELEKIKETSETNLNLAKSEKDKEIDRLNAELEKIKETSEDKVKLAESEKDKVIDGLKAELEKIKETSEDKVKLAESKKDNEISELKAQIKNLEEKTQTAVQLAEIKKDKEISELKDENQQQIYELKDKLNSQKIEYDVAIKLKDEEISRLENYQARLSTKMVGESLERHCETEFNKLRATAFPKAYFGKDNDTSVSGTKGDYIYRELDENGVEIISIMFEMKNESEETKTKHKNEDFFKKLDKDRTAKKCEYAVLVSLLEQDNEFYNTGIADVSFHGYEKMYVIRPQFFIPIITILRNAALNSLAYKNELQEMRNQNIDITNFESNINTFKEGFTKNYSDATNRFNEAIDSIDKSITDLQKVKEKLMLSQTHLNRANNKLDDFTVKKLTKNNPTMQKMFAENKDKTNNE